jgi:SulP family sulfate permease
MRDTLSAGRWITRYGWEELRRDGAAGLAIGAMLIPQGMAYAVIAGVPPIYGLYAGLIPLLIYPWLATSRHLVIGPVAIDLLIVSAAVGMMAEAGTDRYIALAVAMAAMVGITQIAMGLAKLGFVANLLSRPVIDGFTSAAAIIIAASQLEHLLGIDMPQSQYVHELVWSALTQAGTVHTLTLSIGLGSMVLLWLLRRFAPRIPQAIVLVVVMILGSWLFNWEAQGVAVVGDIPSGLPGFDIPDVTLGDLQTLLPAAVTLALVQFMKDISLCRLFATRNKYTVDANRELMAVGAANLFGSFFRSIPVSGSISRSALNDRLGAQTPLHNLFAALVIALTLLVLTGLFYYLPMPALAGLIMMAALSLVDSNELKALFEARRRDFVIAMVTAAATLLVGIQEGIVFGIGATLLAVLYRISRPNVAELGHVPGTRLFRDMERFGQAERLDNILVLRVDAAFSFANAEFFKQYILEKSEREGRNVRVVVIDGTSINDLDTTAIEALGTVIDSLKESDIELHFTGLIGPVREVVRRSGLHARMGEDHFHMDPHDAVVSIMRNWDDGDEQSERLQAYEQSTEPEHKDPTPMAS